MRDHIDRSPIVPRRRLAGSPPGLWRSIAIIIAYANPALAIRDDRFEPAADPAWAAALEAARAALLRVIPGVGMLRSPDLGPMPGHGTAWLVGPDLAVTNRHITRRLGARLACGAIAVSLDLRAEPGASAPPTRAVLSVAYEAEDHDLAFVRLAPDPRAPVLTLSGTEVAVGANVAVIGHPSRDIGHYDPAQIDRMFADGFDIKRLSPGTITAVATTRIDHDCTTLGGNSGSPVVALADGAVVGVHYGGEGRFLTNWAVPVGVVAQRLAGLGA